MTNKPPVIIKPSRKGKTPPARAAANMRYQKAHYTKTPPAEAAAPIADAVLAPIERAKAVLGRAGVGVVRDGMYLLDGRLVSLGTFLRAANDLITRDNLSRPVNKQEPLIGSHHHRWGQ